MSLGQSKYVLLLNNIRLKRTKMRSKRATISNDEQTQSYSASYQNRILQQKNTNIFDTIFTKCANKKNIFGKKSICLKLQQAQRDHCCIDIVNRKNFSCSKQAKISSNIQFLKQHINYLERDQLKWDMFPKQSLQNSQNGFPIVIQSVNKNDYEMHSVNRISINQQPTTLKAFRNTFKRNFNLNNFQNIRPQTSDQKTAKYFQDKGQQVKKLSNMNSSSISERSKAIIHSNITPFRKYFQNSRTKRNHSCTVNINLLQGQKITAKNSFIIQDFTD